MPGHVGTSSTSRPHASATSTGSERRWRSPRPNASDCYARTHAHTCTQACIHANALTGACAHAACSTPGARDTHGRPTSSRLDSDAFDFAGFIGATGVGPILASTSCKFKLPAKSVTHSAVLGTDSSKQQRSSAVQTPSVATLCKMMQRSTTRCNTVQHVATQRTTLPCAAGIQTRSSQGR